MKHRNFPDSVCDIDEASFWGALRVPKDAPAREALEAAIEHGLAGRKAKAYRQLVEHHRASLAGQWAEQQEHADAPAREAVDDLLNNRIRGWHHTAVDFGERIDWNTGAFGQSGQYGFHYLGWMRPATQAYTREDDATLRDWLIRTVTSYYESRNRLDWLIPGMSPVYYELGSGAKTHALLPIYNALIQRGDVPTATAEAFNKLFLGFGRSLLRLQKGYRFGNWQINGCTTLVLLASRFPEYREGRRWLSRGMELLLEHVSEDFFSDGGHKERCWSYGTGCARHLAEALDAVAASDRVAAAEKRKLRRGVRNAYRWFAKTLGPTDWMPGFGDGHLGDAAGVLDQAVRYFAQGTGRDLGVDRAASYLLKPSGYAIMRSGAEPRDSYACLSFGKFMGWHSHHDSLSLSFWALGEPLIEEVGRFDSYDVPVTTLFRDPASHNLVTVDGMHFDNRKVERREGEDVAWHSTDEIDYFSAYHRAYRAQPLEPQSLDLLVRRTVVLVKDPGYLLVYDSVRGESTPHAIFSLTQHWHSPFEFRVTGDGVARTKGRRACAIAQANLDTLRRYETGVDFAGDEVTTKTNEYPDRYWLRARRWMSVGYQGAVGFATVLLPFEGGMPEVKVESIGGGADVYRQDVLRITTPAGVDAIALDPERLGGLAIKGKAVTGSARIALAGRRGSVDVP